MLTSTNLQRALRATITVGLQSVESVDLARLRERDGSSAIDAVIASIDVGLGLKELAKHRLTRREPSAALAGGKARP